MPPKALDSKRPQDTQELFIEMAFGILGIAPAVRIKKRPGIH